MNHKSLVWFFSLAFAATWTLQFIFVALGVPMMSPPGMLLLLVAGVMPSAVAVLLSWRDDDPDAMRALWGRPGARAGSGAVVLALLTPLALTFMAAALLVAGGMDTPGIGFSAMAVPTLIVASLGEEFGWRGFAYPRLCRSMDPLRASLMVGVAWGLWHVPTAFFDGPPWWPGFALFVVHATAASVVIAWLMERAGRRTIVAIAFHAGNYLTLLQLPHTSTVVWVRTAVFVAAAGLAGVALHRAWRRSGDAHATNANPG